MLDRQTGTIDLFKECGGRNDPVVFEREAREGGSNAREAKEIVKAIKAQNFNVQSALQERQIRVTGKKRDELQAVIAFCRSKDFEVGLAFKNFRD